VYRLGLNASVAQSPAAIPADLTRRERRKLEVRGRILEAAVDLFDAQGVADTKVSEICERADVAHKTFFNHFPSRHQLIREIAHEALARMLARIEEVTQLPVPARERLTIYFGGIADEADEAGPMARDLLTEIIHAGHEEGPEQARRIHDAFERLVRACIDAGDFDAGHGIDTLTEMVMGAYYALMFNWAHLEGYPLRRRALAAARFLGDAMSSAPQRRKP
jgi:AcrR family transcriptional regulator